MKMSFLKISVSLCMAMYVLACNTDKKNVEHSDAHKHVGDTTETAATWKEMDEFHMVMAESFHPFMDSTNLEPAKKNADNMAQVAAKWAAAPLPEKVDREEVKAKLDKLSTSAQEFAALVKAGNDDAIGKSLTDLHHLFHEIQNAWYSDNGDDHGEHEHEHEH